ncbi:MAG TPA: hypothetical protein VMM76_27230 [Pirellulaceae bacterium]|nr:hypothetical protein [Pirellulaceae bacterium]
MSSLRDGDGVGIPHASSVLARVILRPGPSAVDGMAGQRMIFRITRLPGDLLPPQYLVASDHEHSTGAAIWTEVLNEAAKRSQPSASSLAGLPHSRLTELPRLFRSH